ncbi:MAG: hypothetical protein ACO1PI_06540 [Bacteroidota bacterium]
MKVSSITTAKFLFILFSAFLVSCSNSSKQSGSQQVAELKLSIEKPFTTINLPSNSYTVKAETGGTFVTTTGTKIKIPQDAFVDKNGNKITGDVTVSFKEMHTPADIIASGIPMQYVNNGKIENFESAGMFEIAGQKNNEPVEIAKGKSIGIDLVSVKKDKNFNYYEFDTKEGRWKELAKDIAVAENDNKKSGLEKLDAMVVPSKPIEPEKTDANSLVVDLDVNYALYPHMKEFSGVLWQYAGTDPSKSPEKNKDVFTANWKYIDLEPVSEAVDNNLFNLTIKTADKTYTAVMKPVLSGKKYETAKNNFLKKKNEYLKALEARENEGERLKREGDFMRVLTVKEFGIYNCDRYYGDNLTYALEWDYEVDGTVDKSTQKVFHICKTDNSVVYYYPNTKDLRFDPNKENCLVAILPGDKIAVFDYDDFKQLKSLRLAKGAKHTFEFKTLPQKFTSVNDLNQILM